MRTTKLTLIALLRTLWIPFLCPGCPEAREGSALEFPSCADGRWDAANELIFEHTPDYTAVVGETRTSESGPRCEDVEDIVGCESRIADALGSSGGRIFLVLRFGNEVRTLRTYGEIFDALSPIDNADEALLLAAHAGFREPACEDITRSGARAAPGGGWDVIAERDYACVPHASDPTYDEIHVKHILYIDEEGVLEERGREESRRRICEDACICFV